ncbi:hypothetical protein [Vogesella fluminis]|uniref:hypothetical protein n=1 Tax=Vogesella fluminis TaxID=1069161 RepID=UPI0016793EAA|nr:hypothetical protein [Vogesella fluminis]
MYTARVLPKPVARRGCIDHHGQVAVSGWQYTAGRCEKTKALYAFVLKPNTKPAQNQHKPLFFLKNTKNNSSLLFATQLTTTKISVVFSHTTQPKP